MTEFWASPHDKFGDIGCERKLIPTNTDIIVWEIKKGHRVANLVERLGIWTKKHGGREIGAFPLVYSVALVDGDTLEMKVTGPMETLLAIDSREPLIGHTW